MKRFCEWQVIRAFVANMVLAYVVYAVCRMEYALVNWSQVGEGLSRDSLADIVRGSLLFDTSAIVYTNLLYLLLMLLPLHYKEGVVWQKVAKWVFVVVNALAVVANLSDSVYFKFTGRRTTATVFSEFANEDNLLQVFVG